MAGMMSLMAKQRRVEIMDGRITAGEVVVAIVIVMAGVPMPGVRVMRILIASLLGPRNHDIIIIN